MLHCLGYCCQCPRYSPILLSLRRSVAANAQNSPLLICCVLLLQDFLFGCWFYFVFISFFFCYFLLLKPKYLSQHPILRHPQPMFLPQCERPSFTLTHNYGKNYSSVYLNLYMFEQQTGRRKICYTVIPSNIILTHILPSFFCNIPNLQVMWFPRCLLIKKNMHRFSASSFYITNP